MKKKDIQSTKLVIDNNVWMLKLVNHYLPSFLILKIINIPFILLNTYINLNITKWILVHIEAKTELHRLILIVVSIFLFQTVINVFLQQQI